MFKRHHLDNGMTVVTDRMTNVRSVSLGIWVMVGSRYEPQAKSGVSHFLEHMFFKGTKKRAAADIATSIDSLGGDLNAFTSKEGTTFYTKVLDEFLSEGLELLTDVFLNSTFPEGEMEKEKGVVAEEIRMVQDTPDDYVHDLFSSSIWGQGRLGQTVLGSVETVGALSRDDLLEHVRRYYGTSNTVVACAGNFNEAELLDTLNRRMGRLRKGARPELGARTEFLPATEVYDKDLSEVHICLGLKGIAQSSPDRYALLLLNTVLGGGMSSRLFQKVREKMGLVYTVYSFLSSYRDTGLWGVYAGTGRKNVRKVLDAVLGELGGLHRTITASELKRAKNQLKGNMVMGLESTSRRMQNIASQEIYYGRYYSPRKVMQEVDAVTLGQVKELARGLTVGKDVALTVMGRIGKRSLPSRLTL